MNSSGIFELIVMTIIGIMFLGAGFLLINQYLACDGTMFGYECVNLGNKK